VENGGAIRLRRCAERVPNGFAEVHASDIGARVEAGGNQRIVRSDFLRQR